MSKSKYLYVIARNRRDFADAVDAMTEHRDYAGERFVWVAGGHSLYGLSLDPAQVLFIDGWEARHDALEIIRSLRHRMHARGTDVHDKILALVGL